jgi:Terpene synthase family 2, C-terminal metal binding
VTSERIPAFSDTAAQIHPRVADIESLSVAWMCDMGLLPRPGLREEVTQGRLCAWACYFYPYADFGYGLLVACWWAWWTYLDDLAMKLDYAAWLKLSADMERVFWHGGVISSDPRSPSPQRQTLTALGDLCRRTFELSTPALYQLIAIGGCDALSGFTMEAFNRHIRRTPGTDLALSADCEYLHTHRKTIGMFIDTAWIEGAVGFAVPEAVRCTPAWQDALETAYDVMILQNDLNGFTRDHATGDVYNAIYLLHQQHGLTPADATAHVTSILTARIARFLHLERVFPERLKHLPLADQDLQKTTDILAKLKTGSQGVLAWYQATTRYNAPDRQQSRRTNITQRDAQNG